MKSSSSLAKVYELSTGHVRRSGFDEQRAQQAYGAYVDYVDFFGSLKGKKTLDLGCGNGWSSYLLSQKGAWVTGIDLHAQGFEPSQEPPRLQYVKGSAVDLPFANQSFDVVTTHECLEHVENPQKALEEMDRVLKSGGMICIVGPNLLSLLQSFRGLFQYVWKVRPLKGILWRQAGMPSHPHGNTLPEIILCLFKHLYWIFKISVFQRPLFHTRTPDLVPPFHADNDACYYLNPLDLKFYFETKGYQVVNFSGKSRPPGMAMIASGTWFCARKK